MKNGNYKKSPVKMIAKDGSIKWFESISKASLSAKANSWTMSLKMQVFGYFEDKEGNKYYRLDEMNTKNIYTSSSPKMIKEQKKYAKKQIKPIPVYIDDVYYENCSEAARALGIHVSTIAFYLKDGRRTIKDHKIETVEEHKNRLKETFQTPQIPQMPKAEIKDENISVVIDSADPAIKAINDRIVELLKQSGIYDEVKKLSKAITKLSK